VTAMPASRGTGAPPDLLLEFVQVFSRFEYALKSAGFAQGDERRVEPDWDEFAQAIRADFDGVRDPTFVEAVDDLLTQPPKKQILDGEKLGWRSAPPDPKVSRAEQALLMARRVRNNLFHGGKRLHDHTEDTARDLRLVESALRILQQCVHLLRDVRDAYES